MGTPCLIALENLSGSIQYIKCHNNGTPDRMSKILNEYRNRKVIQMMMNRGDLMQLGLNLRSINKDENPYGTCCMYQYSKLKYPDKVAQQIRRREDTSLADLIAKDNLDVPYFYLYRDGNWYVMEVAEHSYLGAFKLLEMES